MGAAHQTPPLVGAGRNSWDAWQAGNYLGAVGHTGLFSIEGLGAAESWLGRGMMGGGGLMMVTSSGALVPVAAPFAVGGAAMTAHGSVVMSKALLECRGKDGGGKQSGKNDPHTNRKAKGTAQQDYDKMKADLASYKAKHGKKCVKQKLEWFKKQIKHLKRKADATGETHSRKGKGNR